MKIHNNLSKLVKPSFPTPPCLRNYTISFTDELAPTVNVPLILYYPAPPTAVSLLESSLSETLTDFYPLAGRFVRSLSLVDCSDQGVRYVQANANFRLLEVLALGRDLKPDFLNNFLPCDIGETDEPDDPMLSVKVTAFECGGLAIGMCFSHRLSDMTTICTFINNWASRTRGDETIAVEKHLPIFNAARFFPRKGLPEFDLRVPRSSRNVKNSARRFVFKGKAISAMREHIGFNDDERRRPSKLQLVVAVLWKALVRIDTAHDGRSKTSYLVQAVGLRDKVVPRLPENSCGNFWGLAAARLEPGKGDELDFRGFFELFRGSVKKTVGDFAEILAHGEAGHAVVVDPYLEANRGIEDDDVNFYLFTSWCRFSFYEADFGWGSRPVWASTGKFPTCNLVIMMDDPAGDGVEAWVHLDEKRMADLEQDLDIKAFTY